MGLLLLRTDRSAVKRSAVNIGQQEHYNMVNPVGQMMHAISVLDMVKLGAKIGVKLNVERAFYSNWALEKVL